MQLKKNIIKYTFLAICTFSSLTVTAAEKENLSKNKPEKIKIIEDKTGISPSKGSSLLTLYSEAVTWLKTPYRRGGTSKKGMDCSGLTGTIYQNVFGIKLQRSSRDISKVDVEDLRKDELRPGDLVFFSTSRRSKGVNHVGIFLGNKHFVHASCGSGVIVSSLDEPYYQRTWVKGGKVKDLDQSVFDKEYRPLDDLQLKPLYVEGAKVPLATVPDFATFPFAKNIF